VHHARARRVTVTIANQQVAAGNFFEHEGKSSLPVRGGP
jgi:hypothetical protein